MKKGILAVLALALVGAACSSPTTASPVPISTPGSEAVPAATAPAVITLPPPYPDDSRPLTGRLIIITFDPQQPGAAPYIAQLDLATRALAPLWVPPVNAWLGGMALSPDAATLAVVYAPPAEGQFQTGPPGLFTLPGSCLSDCSGAVPERLVPPVHGDSFYAPAWSPDGAALYFAHVDTSLASNVPRYTVERVPATGGVPESVVPLATWPQVSPDGETLAYVAFDYVEALNDLFFAGPDGSNAFPAMPLGTFWAVDSPVFSPDGQYVYFSATGPGPDLSRGPADGDGLTWLERLSGVQVAYANGAPSDWWRLSVAGGDPLRLTDISASGLSGTFSPDGQEFAFVSYAGIGVMRPDGSDLVWVYTGAAIGSLLWLP
jgi:hypothetical protein